MLVKAAFEENNAALKVAFEEKNAALAAECEQRAEALDEVVVVGKATLKDMRRQIKTAEKTRAAKVAEIDDAIQYQRQERNKLFVEHGKTTAQRLEHRAALEDKLVGGVAGHSDKPDGVMDNVSETSSSAMSGGMSGSETSEVSRAVVGELGSVSLDFDPGMGGLFGSDSSDDEQTQEVKAVAKPEPEPKPEPTREELLDRKLAAELDALNKSLLAESANVMAEIKGLVA